MATPAPQPEEPHIPLSSLRPGFFRCRLILRDLRRFQDLIRHREQWDAADAQPLCELIPHLDTTQNAFRQSQEIDREIQRLMILVGGHLQAAGVSTIWNFMQKGGSVKKQDIIRNYFHMLDEPKSQRYDLLMEVLENGIGAYTFRKQRAAWEMLNPVCWLASLLSAPLRAAELAGWVRTKGQHSRFIETTHKVVYALAILVLVLLAARLKVDIPWAELLKGLAK
jgi:hypothetical protein